jgi:hypothetical protein
MKAATASPLSDRTSFLLAVLANQVRDALDLLRILDQQKDSVDFARLRDIFACCEAVVEI